MANTQADEIRDYDEARLDREINDAYKALFALRFQHATRQLENVHELTKSKRRIARLRTIKRERQLAATEGDA
jgi:large subunit ribosomal protein L29